MGYRSAVRSLIYGDPDKVTALLAKDAMLGGIIHKLKEEGAVEIYQITRQRYKHVHEEPGVDGQVHREVIYEPLPTMVIDLTGEDWKWYSDYPDVQAWEELLDEAAAEPYELNTEFTRLGEEQDDNQLDYNIQDDGDRLLSFSRSIDWDGPEREEIEGCSTPTTLMSSATPNPPTPSDTCPSGS